MPLMKPALSWSVVALSTCSYEGQVPEQHDKARQFDNSYRHQDRRDARSVIELIQQREAELDSPGNRESQTASSTSVTLPQRAPTRRTGHAGDISTVEEPDLDYFAHTPSPAPSNSPATTPAAQSTSHAPSADLDPATAFTPPDTVYHGLNPFERHRLEQHDKRIERLEDFVKRFFSYMGELQVQLPQIPEPVCHVHNNLMQSYRRMYDPCHDSVQNEK
jgi:hypothetical protein